MLLFALILLILLTYTLDESARTQLAQNKAGHDSVMVSDVAVFFGGLL